MSTMKPPPPIIHIKNRFHFIPAMTSLCLHQATSKPSSPDIAQDAKAQLTSQVRLFAGVCHSLSLEMRGEGDNSDRMAEGMVIYVDARQTKCVLENVAFGWFVSWCRRLVSRFISRGAFGRKARQRREFESLSDTGDQGTIVFRFVHYSGLPYYSRRRVRSSSGHRILFLHRGFFV